MPNGEGYRERHRRRRRREFLDAALGIITSEGLPALTMQRVTDELACSVGSIYHYFPSKGALIAELQQEALDVLSRSLMASQGNLERILHATGADERLAALARPAVAAWFWIQAEGAYPREVELLRRQFTAPGLLYGPDEGQPAVDASMALVALGGQLLDGAVAAGALAPGPPSTDRAMLLIAGTTGLLLTSALRRWDERTFDGARLAGELVSELLAAWGAAPHVLAEVERLVQALTSSGELVPRPVEEQPLALHEPDS